MRSPLSFMLTVPIPVRARWRKNSRRTSRVRCLRCRFRRLSAARLLPVKRSRHSARTFLPSATAATSPERRNCWKNRRKAKRECVSWVLWKFHRKPSWQFSSWTNRQAEPAPCSFQSNFRRMEHGDILGGNEHKTCFEHKAKHCPFAFAAKTGSLRAKTKVFVRRSSTLSQTACL